LYNTAGSLIKQATSTSTSYAATGLLSGSVVVIHVWANGGPSAPPHGVLQVTLAKSGGTGTTTRWAYLAPTGLKVTAHTTTSVSLSWNGVTGSKPAISGGVPKPTSYTVAIYTSSTGKLMKEVTSTSTSSTVTGLTANSTINVNIWANGGPLAPANAAINNYKL